jgi:type I pantothenate kinase
MSLSAVFGLDRILRQMRQFFSSALTRSPGPRWRAWAVFSVYVDAATDDIRRWYVERFLRLRGTAFRDPTSYFRRYAEMDEASAVARAEQIWAEINGPNLESNISPTRGRATLVLRKGPEHQVTQVRLRKV